MADFTGLGEGFAAGTRVGAANNINRRNNETNLLMQQRRQEEERNKRAFDLNLSTIDNAYKYAQEQGATLLNSGAPRKDVVRMMRAMIESANENADRMKKIFPGFDPSPFKQRGTAIIDALSFAPTMEEKKKAEAKAEAAGNIAAAGTYAPYVGEEAARLTLPGAKDKATLDVSRRGVAVSEAQQREPNSVNYIGPDGETRVSVDTSRPDARQKVKSLEDAGFTRYGAQVQSPDIGGLGLTKSTQTKVQKDQEELANALGFLGKVGKGIDETPEAVGIRGNLIDASNVLIAQVFPETFNPAVSTVRENIALLRESMMRDVSDDNRFNKDDRKFIAKTLPETGIFESAPEARNKVKAVSALMMQRLGNSVQLDPTAARALLPEQEILNMYGNGTIEKDDAVYLLKIIHGHS